MKAIIIIEYYFLVVLFMLLFKVGHITFESVDEIPRCEHSYTNESDFALIFFTFKCAFVNCTSLWCLISFKGVYIVNLWKPLPYSRL